MSSAKNTLEIRQAATCIVSSIPQAYRLAKKPDGELVLQGLFVNEIGYAATGESWREPEWRDLPIEILPNA